MSLESGSAPCLRRSALIAISTGPSWDSRMDVAQRSSVEGVGTPSALTSRPLRYVPMAYKHRNASQPPPCKQGASGCVAHQGVRQIAAATRPAPHRQAHNGVVAVGAWPASTDFWIACL